MIADHDRHRFAPTQRDRRAVDPDRDRIPPNWSFMQDLNRRALDDAEFEKTPFPSGVACVASRVRVSGSDMMLAD